MKQKHNTIALNITCSC